MTNRNNNYVNSVKKAIFVKLLNETLWKRLESLIAPNI